jgi:dolichyl-phosphate beta-glucosyltransferase
VVSLSVVIPAFAEADYLGRTLDVLHGYLSSRRALDTTEVVVVTADCADGTPELARRAIGQFPIAQHVHPGAKVGKGRDVRAGMLVARGEHVLFMDADLATPLHHVDRAVALLREGCDVVIGRRELAAMHAQWSRSVTSQLANGLVRALLLPGIADTQCGFKAFRRAIVPGLFEPLQTLGWGFDLEILARARGAALRIAELAVHDWHDPKGDDGLAGEAQWVARWRTLRELLGIRRRLGRQVVTRALDAPATASTAETCPRPSALPNGSAVLST